MYLVSQISFEFDPSRSHGLRDYEEDISWFLLKKE
jgi:hypothetical protein